MDKIRYFTFLLFIAFPAISFAQLTGKDSIPVENIKKVTKSPWGMKFELGGLHHRMPNQNRIENQFAYVGSISFFYNHLFIKGEVYSIHFKPKYPIIFSDYVFFPNAELTSIKFNSEVGYNIDFNKKWGSDLRWGVNFTDFSLVNSDELGGSFSTDMIAGAIFGLTLNRYITLREFKFLVLSFNFDYYTTEYKTISRDLKRSTFNYSVTAAYKFWYKKGS